MKLLAIKLHLKSPLRIGEPGVGVEKVLSFTIHSDTLWASIIWSLNRLGKDPSPLIPPGNDEQWSPPFRLSSAFPFLEGVLFFPKPMGPFPSVADYDLPPSKWKELKKATFIPQQSFEKWINGLRLDENDIQELLLAWENLKEKVTDHLEPHVRVGHAAFASQVYYIGFTTYLENAGLYFLAETEKEETFHELLYPALSLLAEEGLGGERTRGFGLFKWEKEEISLNIPSNPDGWLLLSVLIPEEKILSELKRAFYRLHYQRGWSMSSTGEQALRKPIWMFSEGSIFPVKPEGRVVDVTPLGWQASHKVFRHGIAFGIPFKGVEINGS